METVMEHHRVAVTERLKRSGLSRPGPGSISWFINRERLVVAGWGRAILLQLAHPAVAAGVGNHSTFQGSLGKGMGRLAATVGAMRSLTFGTDAEAVETAARINAVHDRITGEGYSAHDPALLQWVHATLLDSIPRVHELLVGPLSVEQRNRYCAEAVVMAPLFNIPAGLLPKDVRSLEGYIETMIEAGRVRVDPTSRALARAVLFPPRWWMLWPAFRPVQLLTIGLLPPAIREQYGFAWTARDGRALKRWTTCLRTARRWLPVRLMTHGRWP